MNRSSFSFLSLVLMGVASVVASAGLAVAAAPAEDSWVRVDATRAELTAALGEDVQSIDYGRFQWLRMPSVRAGARFDGLRTVVVDNPFVLDLGGERFDPLENPPSEIDGHTLDAGEAFEPDWHLVQFKGPIKREWLEQLTAKGLEPVQYIHPFTYVVWGSANNIQGLRDDNGVRWTGKFLARYAVLPGQADDSDHRPAQTMALVSTDRVAELTPVLSGPRGGLVSTITRINRFLSVVHMSLARSAYRDLAAMPGVYTVQRVPDDGGSRGEASARSIVGSNQGTTRVAPGHLGWLDDLGYDGRGVVASVVDEAGFRQTHLDLVDNVVPCVSADGVSSCGSASARNDHATHVAGAIGGTAASATVDGEGFLRGLGVAPGVALVSQNFLPFLGGGSGSMVADGMLAIFQDAQLSGADLVNNSWGPTGTPQGYDIPTMQVDIVTRDANPDTPKADPMLAVWAIMNGRGDRLEGVCAPSSLASPDEAKNLFAVGSTYLLDNAGGQLGRLFDVSWNSAHGNACDGRRVPHVVAPGCNTDSTTGASDTAHSHGGSGNTGALPNGFCGTSMAAPNVTGAAALFMQRHRDLSGGRTPSPALVKAAFTAVATDLVGQADADDRVMGHRPDRFQGYGRIDMDAVLKPAQPVVYVDQTHVFTGTGEQWQRRIRAADPARPIQVMLAWTDAHGHGLGGTTPAWVNDLDLLVETDATAFWGNAVGDDGWSTDSIGADARNNLEGVFLSPAQHAGAITLSVLAANIATDALNPYDPDGDAPRQDFALACYNCIEEAELEPSRADLSVTFSSSSTRVVAGDEVAFDIRIANHGPDAVANAHLRMTLPDELMPAGAAGGTNQRLVPIGDGGWDCIDGDAIECRFLPELASGESAPLLQLTTTVAADAAPGVVTATVRVGAIGNVDPDPLNDSLGVDIKVSSTDDPLFQHGFECDTDGPGCPAR